MPRTKLIQQYAQGINIRSVILAFDITKNQFRSGVIHLSHKYASSCQGLVKAFQRNDLFTNTKINQFDFAIYCQHYIRRVDVTVYKALIMQCHQSGQDGFHYPYNGSIPVLHILVIDFCGKWNLHATLVHCDAIDNIFKRYPDKQFHYHMIIGPCPVSNGRHSFYKAIHTYKVVIVELDFRLTPCPFNHMLRNVLIYGFYCNRCPFFRTLNDPESFKDPPHATFTERYRIHVIFIIYAVPFL